MQCMHIMYVAMYVHNIYAHQGSPQDFSKWLGLREIDMFPRYTWVGNKS